MVTSSYKNRRCRPLLSPFSRYLLLMILVLLKVFVLGNVALVYNSATPRENLSSGFAIRVDSNRPAQQQKLARVLKFPIYKLEVLYYLGSEQYQTARMHKQVFSRRDSINCNVSTSSLLLLRMSRCRDDLHGSAFL